MSDNRGRDVSLEYCKRRISNSANASLSDVYSMMYLFRSGRLMVKKIEGKRDGVDKLKPPLRSSFLFALVIFVPGTSCVYYAIHFTFIFLFFKLKLFSI